MSAIINIETKSVESQSHRVYPVSWNGDGWYPILPEIEGQVLAQVPYLELTIEPVTFETLVPKDVEEPKEGEEPKEPEFDIIETTVDVVTGFTPTAPPDDLEEFQEEIPQPTATDLFQAIEEGLNND